MKSLKVNSSFFLTLEKVDILKIRTAFLGNGDMDLIKDLPKILTVFLVKF